MPSPSFQPTTAMLLSATGAPPLGGGSGGAPPLGGGDGITAAPGGTGGTGGGAPAGGGDMTFIYLVLAMVIGMFVLTLFGQRKERKKKEAMLSAVRKHDRVQTIGGVIGSVVEVKPETIVLKVDEMSNTRMTFSRSAVQQIIKESSEPSES